MRHGAPCTPKLSDPGTTMDTLQNTDRCCAYSTARSTYSFSVGRRWVANLALLNAPSMTAAAGPRRDLRRKAIGLACHQPSTHTMPPTESEDLTLLRMSWFLAFFKLVMKPTCRREIQLETCTNDRGCTECAVLAERTHPAFSLLFQDLLKTCNVVCWWSFRQCLPDLCCRLQALQTALLCKEALLLLLPLALARAGCILEGRQKYVSCRNLHQPTGSTQHHPAGCFTC